MADLRGTNGSVTWAGSTDALVVANIVLWTMGEEKVNPTDVTRPGSLMQRFSFGPINARGILRIVGNNTDATPPLPTGTIAALKLLEDTSPEQSYAFNASLYRMNKTGVMSINGAPQQWTEYSYVSNASAVSDTITVT